MGSTSERKYEIFAFLAYYLNIIMISSCIHFIEDNIILFFFKAKSNTIMYMYHVVSFIHSSAESTYTDSIT